MAKVILKEISHVWKSEVDLCFVAKNLIRYIEKFRVIRDQELPSDHAPISVFIHPPTENLNTLLQRSKELGDHAVLYSNLKAKQLCKKIRKIRAP